MIARVGAYLASEDIVGPARVHDDDGSRNSVPTSRKAWDRGVAAASQRLIVGGTMFGHRLMPSPRKHIAKSPMAAANVRVICLSISVNVVG